MNPLEALKRLFTAPSPAEPNSEAEKLLAQYRLESQGRVDYWQAKPAELGSGQAILEADPQVQVGVLLIALETPSDRGAWPVTVMLDKLITQLCRRALPYTPEDVQTILTAITKSGRQHPGPSQSLLRAIAKPLEDERVRQACLPALKGVLEATRGWYESAEKRKFLQLLGELMGGRERATITLHPDEWGERARAALEALEHETREGWLAILQHCSTARGSKPSKKWAAEATKRVGAFGSESFTALVVEWLGYFSKSSAKPPEFNPQTFMLISKGSILDERNTDLLKGLAWSCAGLSSASLAAALADAAISGFRKLRGHGPRASKVGNACVYALASMPGLDGVAQLERVRLAVKQPTTLRNVEKALEEAAARQGMSRDDLEEITVPTFGLQEGIRCFTFGQASAEVSVEGLDVVVRWFGADGKPRKAAPAEMKREHKEALKDLKRFTDDLKKMLGAQRDRLERLPLAQRAWTLKTWRERYLDHPLLRHLSRRLIWVFEGDGRVGDGIWFKGSVVGADGEALDWLTDVTTVRSWHPAYFDASEVLAWREWLEREGVKQPFKQAHREVYLITEAERQTHTYSNRFAAHIIRQHQFNSLCAARGWRNKLRLMVDDVYPPASLELPRHKLRAEFWVESAGSEWGVDTNQTGTFLYLATDQVRFYPLEAPQLQTHAGGGGYSPAWDHRTQQVQQALEPAPLESIPPVVFSEVMRDADLFVGVCSIGNDPTWSDGGPDGRYRDYWQAFSFGDLSASAESRKDLLTRLLPKLSIGDQCRIEGKFLVVEGKLRTYKIHLGSSNILMAPNDQYLCIVPGRSASGTAKEGLFLPFEGDIVLSIILSKAFMLADESSIADPSITRQIKWM